MNEYFFGEDQGRYLLEIEKNNLEKIEKMLKKGNIFYEVVAEVQNDIFEIDKTLSIKIEELYKCNNGKLNDESFLRCTLNRAAKLANATVLNLISNKFEPQGVTAIALLAESHISIHTWPESNYSAVDIFTCGQNMRPELASQHLIESLMAEEHSLLSLIHI